MYTFLDLPIEIQSLIITEALFTPRPAPRCPSTRDRVSQDLKYTPTAGSKIRHEERSTNAYTLSTDLSLLLTCRQIHSVTKATLLRPRPISYTLDLAILHSQDIYATWLCVPKLTNRVDSLNISIRTFGRIGNEKVHLPKDLGLTTDNPIENFETLFTWFEWNPYRESWSIYGLLPRLLWAGPLIGTDTPEDVRSAWAAPTYKDRKLGVQALSLDFSSPSRVLGLSDDAQLVPVLDLEFPPEEVRYEHWWLWVHGRRLPGFERAAGADLDLGMYKPRPEWLARRLRDEIANFLQFPDGKVGYAVLLLVRVGMVRILVDGKVFWEADIGVAMKEAIETCKDKRFWEYIARVRERNLC
ncbi:hypothetical protein BJY01DRAFT_220276 [Aspergillus pseudoustus]|uniref:F-box domain-containing protein n=1 Tax=Aspergillus pseudoustus TaxID=1810923 RepID=A0ABR4JGM0_9EURO